jgi:hypothetical protein
MVLNLRERSVTIPENGYVVHLTQPSSHATCGQSTVIPPHGVANIQLTGCQLPNNQLLYFPGYCSELLFVPPGIINPADPRVLAINPQDQPFTLKQGRVLSPLELCSISTQADIPAESIQENTTPILGKVKFGKYLPPDTLGRYHALIKKYENIFSPITGPANLPLMPIELLDETPIVSRPHCREPFRHTPWLKNTIDEMLSSGIIRYSNSAFHSPVVIVKKPHGRGWRLCVDYRALNSKTKPIYTVLPDPESILSTVKGFKRMSSVDLTSGFWQLGILPEHSERTAFSTSFGVFEYLAAPMGLRNVPHYFNRAITSLFKPEIDLGFLKTYFDDLNIFSDSDTLHLLHLEKIFEKCQNFNLKINPEKTLIAFEEGPCLGFIVSGETIRPNTEKAQAIINMRKPCDSNEIRVFMGLVNFYRRFLPDLSRIAAPLTDLTKKNHAFNWTSKCDQAFSNIKLLISSDIALHHFDPTAPTTVTSDASEQGWAASLQQSSKIIAFASGRFTTAQSKYAPHERECLGALNGLEKFRHYLVGGPVTLITDSRAISWLQKSKELSPKLFRWSLRLQEFAPNIIHKEGSSIPFEDCGSRLPDSKFNPDIDQPSALESPPGINIVYSSTFPQEQPVVAIQTRAMLKKSTNSDSPSNFIQNQPQNSKTLSNSDSPSNSTSNSSLNINSTPSSNSSLNLISDKTAPLTPSPDLNSSQKSDMNFNSILSKTDWLYRAHIHPLSGHFGVETTLSRLNRFVSWPGMRKDVSSFVRSCHCQLTKSYPRTPKSVGSIPASKFCDLIGIDFLGPFPPTPRNNRYIFFLIESFTNSIFAFPSPTADLASTEYFLRAWISQNDIPKHLITDHHPMFDGPSAIKLWNQLGIHKIISAPHHQSTNGTTERAVGTLKNRLRSTATNTHDWDLQLFDSVTAINHAPSTISHTSPFEKKFSKIPRGSFHPKEPVPSHPTTRTISPNLPPTTINPFSPGCFVKLRSDVPQHFTSPRWTGPFLVVATSPHFATIISPQFKIINTHIDKIAPYHPPPGFHFNNIHPTTPPSKGKAREWEVEDIIGHKNNSKGEITYLTKWVGFPISESTYEPPQNFSKTSLITSYNKKHNIQIHHKI